MIPRLKEKYKKEIIQSLVSKLSYKNVNAVPKIEKIVNIKNSLCCNVFIRRLFFINIL